MQKEKQLNFDFNEILNEFRSDKRLTGKDGLLVPLIKQLTEAALEAEVESHITNDILSGKNNCRIIEEMVLILMVDYKINCVNHL